MTEMEKKYDHHSCEKNVQQAWEDSQIYTHTNNPGQLYTVDTPPPTVSGKLHIGHIFSYTQADIIARYKRMNGFSVFYPFGFDDNGLPTERYVEKKAKIRAHEMSRPDFIALCIKEAKEAAQQFKSLWQRMGLSIDWNYTYSTISDSSRKISQSSFIDLFHKGHIYRKQEPALYCTTCRTSVAQAELDDKEIPSLFSDIIFKDSDGNDLIVATTRPELLPACVAVLYHPEDVRYKKLYGKKAITPLFKREVPIIADEIVSMDKGSGLVMVCTFGDKNDIIWYKKHNLAYHQAIGLNGKCTEITGFLNGLTVTDARAEILKKLNEKNLITTQRQIIHTVGTHERCKKEIEFMILPQWFISILPYKKDFIDIANSISWHPTFMKSRYSDWVENLAWDWGISRQRFYGIPFPAWHCIDCGEILLARHDQLPIDPQETAYVGNCTHCKSTNIVADTDVMDTWNTSSLTPYICYNAYKKSTDDSCLFTEDIIGDWLPMSMRPQAHDIIRTWAFDTIVKTWMHHQRAPWKSIVISGHVLSDKKEKLSKKEGTAMDPEELLKKYPADAIRYWTASGRLGTDITFSQEQVTIGQKLITKLWNAFRFAQPHLENFTTPEQTPEELSSTNEWILHTASACFEKYRNYFEQHECGLALATLEQFFWNDFCDNYIELTKNQLFNPHEYTEKEVYATRWTLYHVGLRILQLYAPYLPHITETIYQHLYANTASLHQTRYAEIQTLYEFPESTKTMLYIIDVITQVRKLKSEQQLSLKTTLDRLTIHTSSDDISNALQKHEQLIRGITQAIEIHCFIKEKKDSSLLKQNDKWYATTFV